MTNSQIEFKNVYKSYQITKGRYGLLTEQIGSLFSRKLRSNKNKLVALSNISFQVGKGEAIGIIGKNGAGKSTILKLISKITYADRGKISARGRIGAFIELGAGLHPELTGRENIYLYGAILGMKRKELDGKFDEIVEFSGIHKFLDLPIKKYSTGMYSRLGFSVVAHCDPDILLVDEVLAVGDKDFQKKCLEKMRSFAKEKTIIFVSHNMDAVKSICKRAIFIEQGKIIKMGATDKVVRSYLAKSES